MTVLSGARGVGKSALSMALAHYVADRRAFERADLSDGVVWCQLGACKTAERLACALRAALDACWGPEGGAARTALPAQQRPAQGGGLGGTPPRALTRRDSTSLSAAQHEAIALRRLRRAHCLLILDGCEFVLAADGKETLALLARLTESAPGVRLLLTTTERAAAGASSAAVAAAADGAAAVAEPPRLLVQISLPHVAERRVSLGPLEPHQAGVLLFRLARDLGRIISPAELRVPAGRGDAFWKALAEHRAVVALGGNPARIAEAALELQGKLLDQLGRREAAALERGAAPPEAGGGRDARDAPPRTLASGAATSTTDKAPVVAVKNGAAADSVVGSGGGAISDDLRSSLSQL